MSFRSGVGISDFEKAICISAFSSYSERATLGDSRFLGFARAAHWTGFRLRPQHCVAANNPEKAHNKTV